MKVYRNRMDIYSKICNYITNPYYNKPHNEFINDIYNSEYGLDLNGVGDPNKRTFEIISQGALRIGEYNDLKWYFDDDFCEETIFKTAEEFKAKINRLVYDKELYNKCLKKQNEIVEKYMNLDYLRKYIEKYLI